MTKLLVRLFAVTVSAGVLASCQDSLSGSRGADRLYGRWEKRESTLPPIALSVRKDDGGATVGQVWLSGVTYTLPAVLDDTSVVLANPASSALAPFVAVLKRDGTLQATIRGTPDVSAVLHRVP